MRVGALFYMFAEAKEGDIWQSSEESYIFEEIVFVVPLEGDLPLPE